MLRFHKTLDIITLFHKASSPASVRLATILKQTSATASSTATEDQVGDHEVHQKIERAEFELNITEELPTQDQLQTILGYVGNNGIPSIIKGASSEGEALKKFKQSSDSFQRPLVVDWNNGKASASQNESEILKMLNALPTKQ